VTDCQLLRFEWVIMRTNQDAELKAAKYAGGGNPLKALEKLGSEKYEKAKITRINTVTNVKNIKCYQLFDSFSAKFHTFSLNCELVQFIYIIIYSPFIIKLNNLLKYKKRF
jgi:hypothetical protein